MSISIIPRRKLKLSIHSCRRPLPVYFQASSTFSSRHVVATSGKTSCNTEPTEYFLRSHSPLTNSLPIASCLLFYGLIPTDDILYQKRPHPSVTALDTFRPGRTPSQRRVLSCPNGNGRESCRSQKLQRLGEECRAVSREPHASHGCVV